MGFSRQEHEWVAMPSRGAFANPRTEPTSLMSPVLAGRFFTTNATWEALTYICRKNIYFCFIDYAKAFDCVDLNKLWKILQEMGIPDHLTYLLRNLYAGQEAIVRTRHGTVEQHGSKLGKEYIKAVYCHLAYLIYMQSISCKMPDWMKNKLESRLQGEYQ